MLKSSLKSVFAHKLRLALSFLAVVLSVAFISGSMIYTDTLQKSFNTLFASIAPDVTVAKATDIEDPWQSGDVDVVPDDVVAALQDVDGVALVEPQVSVNGVQIVGADGEVIGMTGPPRLGVDYSDTDGISALSIVEGRTPKGVDEVAIDQRTVDQGDLTLGQRVEIIRPSGEPVRPTLVGIMRYGDNGNLAGATLAAWDRESAQELLLPRGGWSALAIQAEAGVDDATLKQRVAEAIPAGYDVRTSQEQADEAASDVEEGLSFLNIFLVIFAGISVFVGSFIILNTFSMLVAQRTRELALLRAIGASRGQVTRSVLVEAFVVGLVGATVGFLVGVGLAALLRALFAQIGLELGSTPFVFAPSTFVWAYAIGILVTVAAAFFPAWRASRVPPVAAMRDDIVMAPRGLHLRGVLGVGMTGAGVGALALSVLTDDGSTAGLWLGLGAVLTLVGVIVLSPVVSKPVVGALSAGFPRLFGTVGRLGRTNAQRNPRRTAATASALMIGLALVSAMGTFAASANASISKLVDETLVADLTVSGSQGEPFTGAVADAVRGVEGIQEVDVQRWGAARLGDDEVFVTAADPTTLDASLQLTYVEGGTEGLSGNGLLVDEPTAEDKGLDPGDTLTMELSTGQVQVTVGGVYEVNEAAGPYLVSLQAWEAAGGTDRDNFVSVAVAPGADVATVRSELETALESFPNVAVRDQQESKEQFTGFIDQLLAMIYALLALSIVIAVLGIINTLVLSVVERTREIGLLRAVGMSRRQLRRMITLESVVISVFGAVLGLVVGLALGVALQQTLADDGITELAIPFGSLIGFLVAAAVVGVIAALWPARRAARIDVLRAITTE
jgi:putative ABC transport system permease protein